MAACGLVLVLLTGGLPPGPARADAPSSAADRAPRTRIDPPREPTRSLRLAQTDPEEPPRDPFARDPFASEDTGEAEPAPIPDPLEPWNRAMFWVNDRLYLYGLEPTARGYRTVVPRPVRRSLRNAFNNLGEPTHFLNALLQARPSDAGRAIGRLVINSTVGIGGLFDPAGLYLEPVDRGFDQTFAKWGVSPGFYVVWPLLGPSSARGTVAYAAGLYTDPLTYVEGEDDFAVTTGLFVLRTVNDYSFRIGEYGSMKQHALDPYISLKNLYEQQLRKRRRQ